MQRFVVRDVVDMDVALHGRRFIVGEFALMVASGLAFAGLELYLGAWRGPIVPFQVLTGAYASLVTFNCLTFLVLALGATKQPSTPMAMRSVLWLTAYAVLLLFVPLVFPLTAAWQAVTSNSSMVEVLR